MSVFDIFHDVKFKRVPYQKKDDENGLGKMVTVWHPTPTTPPLVLASVFGFWDYYTLDNKGRLHVYTYGEGDELVYKSDEFDYHALEQLLRIDWRDAKYEGSFEL